MWWYTAAGMVEGNEDGPFPWLVGESDVMEMQAVGCPSSGRKGDASELEFMGHACGLDFRVAKPWGNVDPYDVLVEMGRWFWKVQVKRASRTRTRPGSYRVRGRGSRCRYSKANIDFLVAHLPDRNIWYIVPIEAFEGRTDLYLNPGGKGKYEKYREAWCLLACAEKARGWKDVPVLCRCKELPVRCAVCPNKR